MHIGLFNPGAMGAAVGACLTRAGHQVYWLSPGRSKQTVQRAARAGLTPCQTLGQLTGCVELVISICPPAAAEVIAQQICESGFKGLFLEANAISPTKLADIHRRLEAHHIQLIDGSIIGGPVWPEDEQPNGTTLHLSGQLAETVQALLIDSSLGVNVVSKEVGDASALKMVFAAFSKGSAALSAEILNVAEQYGVRDELAEAIGTHQNERWLQSMTHTSSKAWRFIGEMNEIADTFKAVGATPGFHQAAADVYQRLADHKDWDQAPSVQALLTSLSSKTRH
ncbi:MAG: DUF1932 domain-containing protein [Pseudomonadales bacterium]